MNYGVTTSYVVGLHMIDLAMAQTVVTLTFTGDRSLPFSNQISNSCLVSETC